MADETIGTWTVQELTRFLQSVIEDNPPPRIPQLSCDDITINVKMTVIDQLQLTQNQVTVGSAGTASALPANPEGYFRILDFTGQSRVVPYYKSN
jgi:hypothetical protein